MSPTILFGTGKTRQLNGLFQRSANPATSRYKDVSSSMLASPGTGTVSMPTPHTLLTLSRSVIRSFPLEASWASLWSSHKGSIRPLYPVSLIPNPNPSSFWLPGNRVWMAVVMAAVAAIVPAPPKPLGTSFRTSTAAATLPPSPRDGLKEASSPMYSKEAVDDEDESSSQLFTKVSQIVWIGRTASANPAAKLLLLLLVDDPFFGGKMLAMDWPASFKSRSFRRAPFSNPIANRMRKLSLGLSFLLADLAPGKNGTYGPRLATQNRKFASPPSAGFPSLELSRTVWAATLARATSFAGSWTDVENRPDARPTISVQILVVSGQFAGPRDTNSIPCSSRQSSMAFSRSRTTTLSMSNFPLLSSWLLPKRYSGNGFVAILTV
mmetsp:Transcript_42443/g.83397  ORF Transcript_42443/g.83397 Transcript_42443/m.83397 type:complete len:380 (-) Transcript_42443:629-1768(-)